jgi:hypothetical protein
VGRRRLGSVVWLGMILAGFCLGAFVFAAWPEPTTRLTRLPHGESGSKTPIAIVHRHVPAQRVVASAGVAAPQPQRASDEENVERELAGPPPVAAESESGGYRPETPEELGAKPLPGMHPSVPKPTREAAPTP